MGLFYENSGRVVMAWSLVGMLVAAAVSMVFGADMTSSLMG